MSIAGSRKRSHPSRAASKLPAISEAALHRQVADYLAITIRPPLFWTTFPAGGGGKVRGAKLKAAGLKAGMPDILVFAPGQTYGIELKTPKNYLDPVQRVVHADLKAAGVICFTAKAVDHVALFLRVHRLLPHLFKAATAASQEAKAPLCGDANNLEAPQVLCENGRRQ